MSVHGIVSNVSGLVQSHGGIHGRAQQAGDDFQQLLQAMQAGDMANAQQAYSALQQLADSIPSASMGRGVPPPPMAAAATTVAGDWSALGQALSGGSLSSAQGAFAQLSQDIQAAGAVYQAMQLGSASRGGGASGAASGVLGTDLNALSSALQSGDTSSAQDLLARLEKDLETLSMNMHRRHHHHHPLPGLEQQGNGAGGANASIDGAAASAAGTSTFSGGGAATAA